jgi:hypothetical protein
MKAVRILATAVALMFSNHAVAWNDHGHIMVAAVAWEQLSSSAKARVAGLLKLNPMYQTWINGVADEDRDEVAFVRAATWPDFIKREHAGYTNDGDKPSGAESSQNIGYSDRLQHRYWHFINLPFSTDGTPLVEPKAPNAETQIIAFGDMLASETATDDLRSYDLVWLLHLVGDVHQPLHATSRFSRDLPDGDRGGNLVFLCSPMPCLKELHAFWDEVLGTSESLLAAITAAGKLDDAPTSSAAISDPHAWIVESFNLAKSSVYTRPIGNGGGPFALTDDYNDTAKAIAAERVALAGARLANLINASLR